MLCVRSYFNLLHTLGLLVINGSLKSYKRVCSRIVFVRLIRVHVISVVIESRCSILILPANRWKKNQKKTLL